MQLQMPELPTSHMHNNNHYCRSASLNMAHPQIASHSHWGVPMINRKRDFQFQVIEVRQGPKWFVFPSASKSSGLSNSKKNNSDQENDVTALKTPAPEATSTSTSTSTSTLTPVDNLPRRNSRYGRQRPPQLKDLSPTSAIDDSTMPPAPMSEPTPRRIFCTASTSVDNANISVSAPSDTFKILSVARKVYEEEDDDDHFICKTEIINNNNNNNNNNVSLSQ